MTDARETACSERAPGNGQGSGYGDDFATAFEFRTQARIRGAPASSRGGEAAGVSLVFSTSFKLKGEPIVTTPGNAPDTFAKSAVDSLVWGNVLVPQ